MLSPSSGSDDFERIASMVYELQATTRLLNDHLSAFVSTVDSLLDTLTKEQQDQILEYIENSHTAIDRADRLAIELEAKRVSVREAIHNDRPPAQRTQGRGIGQHETKAPKLPTIPIPTFDGKIWEYDNFWVLFQDNVHNQSSLTNLQKFNYLLSALQGEARDLVKRYPITEDNYVLAIDLMKKKYANKAELVRVLQKRLDSARSEKPSTQGQRKLLEFVIPLVMQLHKLEVNLDGSYNTQKLLSKFAPRIQRKVLEDFVTQDMSENAWKMQSIVDALDAHIATEERINSMVSDDLNRGTERGEDFKKGSMSKVSHNQNCLFCGSPEHRTASCSRYSTLTERRNFLQEHGMCLNCGREGHFASKCTKEGCRNCQGKKHFHALCPRRLSMVTQTKHFAPTTPTTSSPATKTVGPKAQHSPTTRNGRNSQTQRSAQAHPIHIRDETNEKDKSTEQVQHDDDLTVLHQGTQRENVVLLTGVAHVWNPKRQGWQSVVVLLDTGADQSFISQNLSEDLGLECVEVRNLEMYTFGAKEPKSAKCAVTSIKLGDNKGEVHNLRLYSTPILTEKGQITQLSQEDLEFISHRGISLSKAMTATTTKPQILLGCDQLWDLLEISAPHYTLPSGLKLIPSKLGYLLSGKQQLKGLHAAHTIHVQPSMIAMINAFTEEERDLQRWDKYWTMDSAGICEFTGTKDAEKTAVNEKVSKFFADTIEKRSDGYYVRLPFKENHPPLPTNKAIAMKRLHSVINMLKSQPQILADYDNTFKTQLEKEIIEEVPEEYQEEAGITHYIPHQPVITPHKETTKLRIVFDASSHFKDRPSLNDVLHQGPLILPDLYAVLLRFRVAKYVVTSDVEKAFLQVRLHEKDRDVTRFFWVRDYNKEPEGDNVITYRFTRVTFGLNVSPFLLGATIQYHLRNTVSDTTLGNEIRENLYVDNLILTAETKDDAIRKSVKAREIFAEMNMNLREFLSNNTDIATVLSDDACAKTAVQKILGIKWNSENDTLFIRCDIPGAINPTKRIVARQIASIYDPFGWMVPLLTQLKRFQQDLWKHKYSWDTILPPQVQREWETLTSNVHGFEKSFERRFMNDGDRSSLAVFADASTIAMSTCAYLFTEKDSTLVMAKCKLPSLHSNTTIPKMELNAITIAVRLARSIFEALRGKIAHRPFNIYVFSDSQIALSWLSTPPNSTNVGVLVSNRLKEIRSIVKTLNNASVSVHFYFVETSENPADAGTRGLTKEQLGEHIWWKGPKFLRLPIREWPGPTYELKLDDMEETLPELGAINATTVNMTPIAVAPLLDLRRFSSFQKAKRVAALTLLFLKKLIKPLPITRQNEISDNIRELQDSAESLRTLGGKAIEAAKRIIVRNHQAVYYTNQYRKSVQNTLRLFKDDRGLWCSRGRVGNSALSQQAKNPVFIHQKTPLASLIINEAHGDYHLSIEHTIATVRLQYWIPKLRQQVRHTVKHCVRCRRFNGLPYAYPETTDLPQRRVTRSHAFQHVGIDYFDLPTIEENEIKLKIYGCIFTCTVTRLIHLELVKSMAIGDFLNALRRFIARRGVPSSITSDNAPTFLLSADILNAGADQTQLNTEVLNATSKHEIEWYWNTPYAPWQGGFYERLIKSIKHALYKSLRVKPLRSVDDLETILAEIEACLNSRPLTYQSSEHDDFSSIRPIDFIQRNLNLTFPYRGPDEDSMSDPDYTSPGKEIALRTRRQAEGALKSSCEFTERFWDVWQKHYLTSLRETHKRFISKQRNHQLKPKVGTVVLLSDPILPRNAWKMARISDLHYGKDGQIREVELVTATKRRIKRPVNLIVPLEITDDDENFTETEPLSNSSTKAVTREEPRHSYNLRPRNPVNYSQPITNNVTIGRTAPQKWFLFHIMILSLITTIFVTGAQGNEVAHTGNGTTHNASASTTFRNSTSKQGNLPTSPDIYMITFPLDRSCHDYAISRECIQQNSLSFLPMNIPVAFLYQALMLPHIIRHAHATIEITKDITTNRSMVQASGMLQGVIAIRLLTATPSTLDRSHILPETINKRFLGIRRIPIVTENMNTNTSAIDKEQCFIEREPSEDLFYHTLRLGYAKQFTRISTQREKTPQYPTLDIKYISKYISTPHAESRFTRVWLYWKLLGLPSRTTLNTPHNALLKPANGAQLYPTMVFPDTDIRRKYRRLVQAIPQLPKPTQLYKKIVHGCRRLHVTMASTTTLMTRIQNLRTSQEGWKECLTELQIVETLREKTVVEYMLLRTELRTLFSLPPILIAMDAVSENNWKAMMSQPQYDEEGNAILTRQSAIETVIEDQLKALEEAQALLNEYRNFLQEGERKESQQFQSTVLTLLSQVQEKIEHGFEKATQESEEIWSAVREIACAKIETPTETHSSNNGVDSVKQECRPGEGIRMNEDNMSQVSEDDSQCSDDVYAHEDDEAIKIQQNADFMEGVQEMDEEEESRSSQSETRSQRADARRRLRQEIQQTEEEIAELEAVIYELDMEPTCDPRDFAKGLIRNQNDSKLSCSFCGRVGHHYSDSCAEYSSFWDRRYIANAQSLCTVCLKFYTEGHLCRKVVPCFHCKKIKHHSALCDLPERSEEIRRQYDEATNKRRIAKRKLEELERRLQDLEEK